MYSRCVENNYKYNEEIFFRNLIIFLLFFTFVKNNSFFKKSDFMNFPGTQGVNCYYIEFCK